MNQYRCKNCNSSVVIKGRYHAGFSQVCFLYCDRDDAVLTFSVFDPIYEGIVGRSKAPDHLSRQEQRMIEEKLIRCNCGGHFSFDNSLKCPICDAPLSEPITKDIYYIVLNNEINEGETKVWVNEA